MAKKSGKPNKAAPEEGGLVRVSDVETTRSGVVKRWVAELSLADKAEEDWRKEVDEIWKRYTSEQKRASSFNILWPNTEIMSAAVYNSTPQPDVRRRFRDEDAIGKQVSKILERASAYEIDDDAFDEDMDDSVLDMLITGRGVVRIKYEPVFVKLNTPAANAAPELGELPEAESEREKLADQRVPSEHVNWKDFRHGPGKRWREIPWLAFRHQFTQEMAEEKFGTELATALSYEQGENTDDEIKDRTVRAIFKTCEVWEIWDKEGRRVLFIAPSYDKSPCLEVPDPLHLKDFWPMPRAAYAVRNSNSLVPTPIYRLYEEQAKELDDVSARISKIVRSLKVRGAYNAALSELGKILEADDVEMLAVETPEELKLSGGIGGIGGLEKNVWVMPVDKLIDVLKGLYIARDQIKNTIYEICGIADVIRGASDPNETLGAQKIKSQWGSIRVQKMQREVQRMARDLIRLKVEVIAEQYAPDHLAAITQVKLPTDEQKQQASQAAAVAQQSGQPIPPEAEQMLKLPSWGDVMKIMKSDELRCYRVDVETDSTVAETIERDMTGLGELLASLSGWVDGAFKAVQAGAMTIDTLKEIALAVIRRARLGNAVEDAFEQLKAPPPAPDQGEQLNSMKQQLVELIKGEGAKLAQAEAGLQQREQQVVNTTGQIIQGAQQLGQSAQVTAQQAAMGGQAAQMSADAANQTQALLVQITQLVQTLAKTTMQAQAQTQAAMAQVSQSVEQSTALVTQSMQAVMEALQRPKKITIERGADGRMSGGTASIQ